MIPAVVWWLLAKLWCALSWAKCCTCWFVALRWLAGRVACAVVGGREREGAKAT